MTAAAQAWQADSRDGDTAATDEPGMVAGEDAPTHSEPTSERFLLPAPMFPSREAAGDRLAVELLKYRNADPLILGIPRGGIPVAAAVARRLGAELDVFVARKIGVPSEPELAMGAVTAAGGVHVDQETATRHGVTPEELAAAIARETEAARTRDARFRGAGPRPRIEQRTVIVVDDGLATGETLRATLTALRAQGAARLVAAVPVAPHDARAVLQDAADEFVCLYAPEPFEAVGVHYDDFRQVTDETVEHILQAFQSRPSSDSPIEENGT